ncbi:copper transporter [Corynebacterium sp. H113]|uniref:copper transporter n=1 Tax=Corynebacterium sp. H113 TaxID=3133419 RepID=UPI0030A73D50
MAKNRKSGRGAAAVTGLALGVAAGTALGAYVLAPEGGITLGSSSGAAQERDTAVSERDRAIIRADSANEIIEPLTQEIVKDALKDTPVVLAIAPDAKQEDVDAVAETLKAAGAPDGGRLNLTQKFISPEGADGLKDVVNSALPASVQLDLDRREPGRQAGQALSTVLMLDDEGGEQASGTDRKLLLESLRDGGYVEYKDGTLRPSAAVVLVTGAGQGEGKDPAFGATVLADFAEALSDSGPVVVASQPEASEKGGVLAALKAKKSNSDSLKSVAAIGDPAGRVGVVRAIVEARGGVEKPRDAASESSEAPEESESAEATGSGASEATGSADASEPAAETESAEATEPATASESEAAEPTEGA